MHVADPTAPPARALAGREVISARATYASTEITQLHQEWNLTVQQVPQASPAALHAMHYIADSSRLTRDEKKTLIRLVAIVDQFAGGDPKLMSDIIGIAKMMEADTPEGSHKRHSMRDVMQEYLDDRAQLGGSGEAVTVSVETEILLVRMSYADLRVDVAP